MRNSTRALRTQWSQIIEADAILQRLLDDAYALAHPHVAEGESAEWDRAWEGLRQTLKTIRSLGAETRERFAAEGGTDPLQPWSDLLDHEEEMKAYIATIGKIGSRSVPAIEQQVWNDLFASIDLRSSILQAQSLTVRFQLELRQKYGEQQATEFSQKIAAKLPADATLANVDERVGDYCKAVEEYEAERETFGGAWDILKSLLLVPIKTPAERVEDQKRQSL